MSSLAQNNLPELKNRKKKDTYDLFYLYVSGHASQGSTESNWLRISGQLRLINWSVNPWYKLQNRLERGKVLGKSYHRCNRYQWRDDDRGYYWRFDELCCLWFLINHDSYLWLRKNVNFCNLEINCMSNSIWRSLMFALAEVWRRWRSFKHFRRVESTIYWGVPCRPVAVRTKVS